MQNEQKQVNLIAVILRIGAILGTLESRITRMEEKLHDKDECIYVYPEKKQQIYCEIESMLDKEVDTYAE